jgi:uncharacterized protein DUF5719
MSPGRPAGPRRWPALVVVVGLLAGFSLLAHSVTASGPRGLPPTPGAFVNPAGAESTAWFCAGQTTAAGQLAVGSLDLTNTGSRAVTATITARTDKGATVASRVTVPARGQYVAGALSARGTWSARTVVISGGGVAVTQAIHGPTGWAVSPCLSGTSQQWYFPVGTTSGSDALYMALFNPTSTPDVVDLTFVTPTGILHPISFQGIVLQPQQTQVENVGTYVQDQSTVATTVTTRTGRVVASETQAFSGPVSGLANLAGSPLPQRQWSIPQGQEVAQGSTSIDIFNPGATTEDVTVQSRLASGPLPPFHARVLPDSVWQLVTSAQTRIPKYAGGSGGYSTDIVATGGQGVVVGRAVATPSGSATPQAGLANAVDALSATSSAHLWVVPSPGSPSTPSFPGAMVTDVAIFNPTASSETYSVSVLSPHGIRSLTRGRLPPFTFISLSGKVLDPAFRTPLLVSASGSVAVTENVGPTGGYGVVTIPGMPLSADPGS